MQAIQAVRLRGLSEIDLVVSAIEDRLLAHRRQLIRAPDKKTKIENRSPPNPFGM
jgi:hypothetical protein